jgi:hypothetical protein
MPFSKNLAKGTRSHQFLRNIPHDLFSADDKIASRIVSEYGAIFVAAGGASPPDRVIFEDENDVSRFQSKLKTGKKMIGDIEIELQEPAMVALNSAIESAVAAGVTITPRGAESARRNYQQTVDLWASRVEPALDHWVIEKRLTQDEADSLRLLSAFDQVAKVFDYEAQGIFFAKTLDKPIMYSVAPPGTSQHLSMLALDVAEFNNVRVREILHKTDGFRPLSPTCRILHI